jgi:hypothetical protein
LREKAENRKKYLGLGLGEGRKVGRWERGERRTAEMNLRRKPDVGATNAGAPVAGARSCRPVPAHKNPR